MAVKLGSMEIVLGLNIKAFEKKLRGIGRKFGRMGRQLKGAGQTLTTGITAPLAAIGFAATKAAIDWETSFANVRKTVAGTEEQLNRLSLGIRGMSQTLPVAAGELASIAEEAGRLGVARGSILQFTETVVRLAETSTLSSEEAAISLARLIKQTSASSEDVEKLATSLTVLGSEFETNESSIAEMAQRLSVTGDVIGLSANEILGFSAAMSAAGIQAESGGTAMGDVFIKIAAAVDEGGAELDKFSKIAGTTSAKFKKQFKTDASGALVDFVKGLKNVKDSGGSVFEALENIGLSGKRQRLVLLALQKDTDGLVKALKRSKTAWDENTALTELSNKRFETTGAKIRLVINKLQELARQFGEALMPAVETLISTLEGSFLPAIKKWVRLFSSLDGGTKAMIISIFGIAAVVGPLIILVGQLTLVIEGLAIALTFLAAHPIVAVAVAISALVLTVAGYNALSSKMRSITEGTSASLTKQARQIETVSSLYVKLTKQENYRAQLLGNYNRLSELAVTAEERRMSVGNQQRLGIRDRIVEEEKLRKETEKLYLAWYKLTEGVKGYTLQNYKAKIGERDLVIALSDHKKAKEKIKKAYALDSQERQKLMSLMAQEQQLIEALIEMEGRGVPEALAAAREKYEEYRLAIEKANEAKGQAAVKSDEVEGALKRLDDALDQQKTKVEENLTVWEEWGRRMGEIVADTSAAFRAFTFEVMTEFSEGFGRALASTLVAGESFGDAMKNLWKQIASTVISRLVSMGVQLLLYSLLEDTVATNSARGTISKAAGKTYAESFASVISALPFPANVLAAPIVAATQSGIVLATGNSIAAAAQGGILTGPQIVLAGEAGPEAIIPLDRLGEFTGGRQTVNLYMDSELVSEAVIEGMPSVLEARLGGI